MLTKHSIAKKYIQGVIRGYSNSLIIKGNTGTGKTEIVFDTLQEMGLEENIHYLYLAHHITPKGLVQALKQVNELESPRLLLLDDIDRSLQNPELVGVLKNATWESNGVRRVSWISSRDKINFMFEGRVIILLNKINKQNSFVEALLDRGYFYELELNRKEILELIRKRAKLDYAGIPIQQRFKIVDFIEKNSVGSEKLSLRTLQKAFSLYILTPHTYQSLLLKQLK